MDSTRPSLSVLKRDYGNEFALDAIVDLIISAQEFFNVTVKMSAAQISETADIILERYYFLKIAELKLCFRNAKAGDYGEIYNRVDGSIVMGWLAKYDESRNQAIIKANKSMQNELDGIYETTHSDDVVKALRLTVDKLAIKERHVETEFKPREKTRQEQLFQDLLVEFDEIWAASTSTSEGLKGEKMIWIDDRWMDRNAFVEFKISNK